MTHPCQQDLIFIASLRAGRKLSAESQQVLAARIALVLAEADRLYRFAALKPHTRPAAHTFGLARAIEEAINEHGH